MVSALNSRSRGLKCWGWTGIPSRGGVVILLTASRDRNRHTLRLDRPLRSSADFRRSRGRNICLSFMTYRTHCPRSTRHECEPNTAVSHLALHLIYRDIQVLFTKAFSTMHDMFPSAGEVDHSCPCEGFITHTFRAPPSSHDIVARRPFLCFLGWRESLCRCRGIPRLLSLNWHFLCWTGVGIFCLCTLSRWICLGDLFLEIW